MALGDNYISLNELKSRVGISVSDTGDDDELNSAISTASRSIEDVADRQFNDAGAATARSFYAENTVLAYVDDFHTTTDGLIVKTDTTDDGTFDTTWASADYQLEPLAGVVRGQPDWPYWRIRAVESKRFPCGRRAALQVTAQWGWAGVPAPVKEATLILAEDLFKLKDTPFGSGGFGEFGRIRARRNPHVMTQLGPYILDPVLVG